MTSSDNTCTAGRAVRVPLRPRRGVEEMTVEPLLPWVQNCEDVLLWLALGNMADGPTWMKSAACAEGLHARRNGFHQRETVVMQGV